MICKRGDVVLVWYPDSNQQSFKRRPALVVQADGLQTGLAQYVLVMITSNLARQRHPSRVAVIKQSPEGVASGLVCDSVVMTDNMATILDKAIERVLGSLPNMDRVDQALRHTLGL